jgi:hypothetical protein
MPSAGGPAGAWPAIRGQRNCLRQCSAGRPLRPGDSRPGRSRPGDSRAAVNHLSSEPGLVRVAALPPRPSCRRRLSAGHGVAGRLSRAAELMRAGRRFRLRPGGARYQKAGGATIRSQEIARTRKPSTPTGVISCEAAAPARAAGAVPPSPPAAVLPPATGHRPRATGHRPP